MSRPINCGGDVDERIVDYLGLRAVIVARAQYMMSKRLIDIHQHTFTLEDAQKMVCAARISPHESIVMNNVRTYMNRNDMGK